MLAVLAALNYADATEDGAFLVDHGDALRGILAFYEGHLDGDLVVQPSFSDWQDSVRRSGRTLYTNLLWSTALTELSRRGLFGITQERAERTRAAVHHAFFDDTTGLYRSLEGRPQISMDGNLLAIELGFVQGAKAKALYTAMKRHPLWSAAGGLPGVLTMPDYPLMSRNWSMLLVGLGHYHDRLAWSWITALAAKVAARMGDQPEAERILDGLEKLIERDNGIAEIYEPARQMRPWQRWLYHSERPFSWGAAMALDAYGLVRSQRLRRDGHTPAAAPTPQA